MRDRLCQLNSMDALGLLFCQASGSTKQAQCATLQAVMQFTLAPGSQQIIRQQLMRQLIWRLVATLARGDWQEQTDIQRIHTYCSNSIKNVSRSWHAQAGTAGELGDSDQSVLHSGWKKVMCSADMHVASLACSPLYRRFCVS